MEMPSPDRGAGFERIHAVKGRPETECSLLCLLVACGGQKMRNSNGWILDDAQVRKGANQFQSQQGSDLQEYQIILASPTKYKVVRGMPSSTRHGSWRRC